MDFRPATPDDLPQLCQLLGILFRQEADFHPDPPAQIRGLSAILADPATGTILVASARGRLAGMVSLLWLPSLASGGMVAMLEDMVVLPGMRGQGVGSSLLGMAVATCRKEGCRHITLLTDGTNLAGQRFYQQHQFAGLRHAVLRAMLK